MKYSLKTIGLCDHILIKGHQKHNVFIITVIQDVAVLRPIKTSVENALKYVKASMALHNYLRQTNNAFYSPAGFMDCEDASGNIKLGEWRSLVPDGFTNTCFQNINNQRGRRYGIDALEMRDSLADYMLSEQGELSWHINVVVEQDSLLSKQ